MPVRSRWDTVPAARRRGCETWWRISGPAASRLVKLASALSTRPGLAAALADGVVNAEQVGVVSAGVARLPVIQQDDGERFLLEQADVLGPRELSRIGERLFEVLDPGQADRLAEQSLEREERRAYGERCFSVTEVAGCPRVRLSGWLDREAAAVVRAALDPLCAPCSDHGERDPRSPTQRRADALTEVCRLAMACGQLPDNGGDRPQLVVTIPYPALRRELDGRLLDTGWLTGAAGQSRRPPSSRTDSHPPAMPVALHGDASVAPTPLHGDASVAPAPLHGDASVAPAPLHGDASVAPAPLHGAASAAPAALKGPPTAASDGDTTWGRRVARGVTTGTGGGAVAQAAAGIAVLDDGGGITAEAARRIACDATILPAVLGGRGQVLDLGRSRRLFGGPIRRALVLRDGGCAFPGCDRPARWCDGHHIVHWADGGTTDLGNSVLLCGHHHRVIHHSDWRVRISPADGLPEFVPPALLDPAQRPRRNTYHHPQHGQRQR